MGEAELSTEVVVMWWVSVWRVGWVAGFAQDSVDLSMSGKHREWQQAVCSLHFRFYLNQAHAAAPIHPLPAWILRSTMACLECYSNCIRLAGGSRYQTNKQLCHLVCAGRLRGKLQWHGMSLMHVRPGRHVRLGHAVHAYLLSQAHLQPFQEPWYFS